jgi:hypothetical protein
MAADIQTYQEQGRYPFVHGASALQLRALTAPSWQTDLRQSRAPINLKATGVFVPGFKNDLGHYGIHITDVVAHPIDTLTSEDAQDFLNLTTLGNNGSFGASLRIMRQDEGRNIETSRYWYEAVRTSDQAKGYLPYLDRLDEITTKRLNGLLIENLAEILAYREDAPDKFIPAAARGQTLERMMIHGPWLLVFENGKIHVMTKSNIRGFDFSTYHYPLEKPAGAPQQKIPNVQSRNKHARRYPLIRRLPEPANYPALSAPSVPHTNSNTAL